MAPATPRSAAGRRKRLHTAPSVVAPLPPDMLSEVFLNLPPAPVCRFRAVCRSWRALLSGRAFLAAHAARRGPLLLAAAPYRSRPSSCHVDLVDLAGAVAVWTRVSEGGGVRELLPCGDLACLVGNDGRVRVLDPAAGAVTAVPHGLSPENEAAGGGWARGESFQAVAYAFGRVSSTGEHKLLRLVRFLRYAPGRRGGQLIEVLTVGGGEATWRSRRGTPFVVAGDADYMAVVDGVVYFLAVMAQQLPFAVNGVVSGELGSIAAFDLETEEWMPILRGSLSTRRQGGNPEPLTMLRHESPLLTLTELNGFLVTVHRDRHPQPSMDLWFLIDSEPETWVKNYSIRLDLSPRRREFYAHPLFVDDTKMLFWVQPKRALKVYDLQTGSCKDLDHINNCDAVGLYNGSILSPRSL
ncbi:unnamed protein product [Urochloa decumbens]|uniref:F-box domain-containing protein n=1 Tax=Urochloa decumbens TaxID=240449 RepID=A0ABC8WCP2_9POAL